MPSTLGVEEAEAKDNIINVLEKPTNHFNYVSYVSNAGNAGNASSVGSVGSVGSAGNVGDVGKSSKSGAGQVSIEESIKIILIAKDTYLFEYKY
jgi:hypothetical protein